MHPNTCRTLILFALFIAMLMSLAGCAKKYTTTTGQVITLKEHEALFLHNCENNKWWDKHSPAANCGFFGKDTIRYDPVGSLRFLKKGCDNGDDLSCLEFVSNAYKLSTDDRKMQLIRSYTLPADEVAKARSYSLNLCLNREIFLRGANSSNWLCYFAGKLHSEVKPVDKENAAKAFRKNCDVRNDCEELKKLENIKPPVQ